MSKQKLWLQVVALLTLLATGCSTTLPPILTYEEAKKQVDAKPAYISPTIEEREGFKLSESKPVVVLKDSTLRYPPDQSGQSQTYVFDKEGGLVVSPGDVRYYTAIKAERDRRRAELESAYRQAEIKRLIYESTIERLQARLKNSNNWWEQNKGLIGFSIGATVGMALVVGLVYGLTKGAGMTTQTSGALRVLPEPVR